MNIAIICAGGNGERMKARDNKIFLHIDGKPIIYYTLKTFDEHPDIDSIIITAQEKYFKRIKQIISKNNIKKVDALEKAYGTRQESTYHVLKKLSIQGVPEDSLVLIHNAVNPFVRHSEIDRCIEGARTFGASLLGFQAIDTVKIIDEDNFIVQTPERKKVWIAQTPQVIRFNIALRAFENAEKKGYVATDDTTLVEMIRNPVKFIECSRENFKITYPQDLELAKKIYYKRIKEKKVWYV